MKKSTVIGLVILALVVVLFAFVFVIFIFNIFSKDSPEEVVEEMFEAFLDGDYEEMDTYVNYKDNDDEFEEEFEDFINEIVDYVSEEVFDYEEIEEVSNNDRTAKVSVKITAVDAGDFMEKFEEEVLEEFMENPDFYNYSEKEQEEYTLEKMVEMITDGNIDTVTKKITLTLKKDKENNWKVQDNDAYGEIFLANHQKFD